ncbi:SARP family transcriptional regulator [Treponema primitia]|uniref:SARP family transcriptional regulator n=1 Tax=Treponema primitia TaxID=88058 RepID=UPI00397FF6EC
MLEEEDEEFVTQAGIDARRSSQPVSAAPIRARKTTPGHKPYTPQFSELATVSVRRLAWALGKKMPAAVDHMVQLLVAVYKPASICGHCQDKSKCQKCIFSQPPFELSNVTL